MFSASSWIAVLLFERYYCLKQEFWGCHTFITHGTFIRDLRVVSFLISPWCCGCLWNLLRSHCCWLWYDAIPVLQVREGLSQSLPELTGTKLSDSVLISKFAHYSNFYSVYFQLKVKINLNIIVLKSSFEMCRGFLPKQYR